jgi:hypothetical protein
MARPIKNTVDYFPHVCKHNKTMFIIESHFGNDGYAFWFKLLECLGSSENHYINCNLSDVWEYLQARVKLEEEICIKILDKLAKLDAIDAELWESKIVYSDNFVQNIADAYEKRKTNMMTKTELMSELTEFMTEKTTVKRKSCVVKGVENTQSIVEDIKGDKSIKKESKKEYAELVLLSENEYSKLTDKYGEIAVKRMIEILDNYKGANGKKYTSDYKAILNWVVERYEKEQFTKGDKKSKVNDLKSEYGEFL